jgi:hypothetical protein
VAAVHPDDPIRDDDVDGEDGLEDDLMLMDST